ncbi:MAG TPA: glycosyltransferase family 2 protein [Terriglobia bacterium]|nr:glycosyltransferase family 2 protein [Terriglobia bacterium]
MNYQYALIIPALNEAETIGPLLRQIPANLFSQIIVVDNGSRDLTAETALAAGAQVIREPRRGYGQACISGLEQLKPSINAVVFMDADLSDDPQDLERLIRLFGQSSWDMVMGSRVLGSAEKGALTPIQRFGNWLTTRLIVLLWNVHFTDLGPLRILRRDSLERLKLQDRTYGWNVEMQAKAAQLGLKTLESPVNYRQRQSGRSKISGSISGSFRAGVKILWTVYRCWRNPLPPESRMDRRTSKPVD